MPHFLMDVVDAGVSESSGSGSWIFLGVIVLTIAAEAGIMLLMKYNRAGKAFADSFIVNALSLGVGYILIRYLPDLFNSYTIPNLLKLMLITIAVETAALWLLNRKRAFVNTVSVSAVMNVVTYLLFYVFIQLFAR